MGQAVIAASNTPVNSSVTFSKPAAVRWSGTDRLIAVAVVLAGIVLRLLNYLHSPSLWQDEASLSLNLRSRTFGQLLKPLDYDQGAPVGFLMLVKSVISLLHVSELTLRLVPLMAGIAVLVFAYQIAWRTGLSPLAGSVLLAMLAVSQTLVNFSVQIKQYSLDSAIAIGLVLPALAFVRLGARPRTIFIWSAAAGGAVWFSHPSVFVIGGTVLTVIVRSWATGRNRDAIAAGLVGAVGAISFAVSYVLFDRALVGNAFLQNFWKGGYMPWDSAGHAVGWIGKSIVTSSELPLGNRSFPVVMAAVALGIFALIRRREYLPLGLFAAPAALSFVAAVIHRYPFEWRLLSFLVPSALWLCAAAVDWLWTAAPRGWQWTAPILAAGLITVSFFKTSVTLIHPFEQQQTGPVFAYIEKHRAAGEPICVVNAANTPYLYYRSRFDLGPGILIDAKTPEAASAAVSNVHGRVWIYTVNLNNGMVFTEKPVFTEFESRGRRRNQVTAAGVEAFEYDMP